MNDLSKDIVVEKIESNFIEKGWIQVSLNLKIGTKELLLYPCLIHDKYVDEYIDDSEWKITPGSEGKPTISTTYNSGNEINSYHMFNKEGIEPLIFIKSFRTVSENIEYTDISEDLILYFNLYEKGNKQRRTYFYLDKLGELEEVISIENDSVRIKLRYLNEYLAVRKIHLALCFDFREDLDSEGFSKEEFKNVQIVKNNSTNYSSNVLISWTENNKFSRYMHGKSILNFDSAKSNSFHFDPNYKYESFVTDYDKDGEPFLEICEKSKDNLMKLTFFKKDVLDKYYANPEKYKVSSFGVKSDFFHLRIDNNMDNIVAVFLTDFSKIPHKEQLHWKQYNILPQEKISHSFFHTMIEGRFVESPETPDLYFKAQLIKFNRHWESKFGWKLFKPLSVQDSHHFDSLHIPTKNSPKDFSNQILSLVKIFIDSLNEKELVKGISIPPKTKGIGKFEIYLNTQGYGHPELIEFLKNLQTIRSGMVAHRFSKSNKDLKKAMAYFRIEETGEIDAFKEILIKCIKTLNTLEPLTL